MKGGAGAGWIGRSGGGSGPHRAPVGVRPVYRRLVGSLGTLVVGGWGAFLLDGHESSHSAALVVVGVGVLAGGIAGWRLAILVAVEAVVLVALGLRLPILVSVWGDTGPFMLVPVAILQLPVAAAAARPGSLRRS